jgi:probable phosphoglycerate mutase
VSAPERLGEVWLVRHGQTEWSRSGQHTSRTDLPLLDEGREQAAALAPRLRGHAFALVLSSPMQRALDTCRLTGLSGQVEVTGDLCEWDYGEYEGRTTAAISDERPDWSLWRDGGPGGEVARDVGTRVDRVIARARAVDGDVALFAHGHLLRVLAARWLDLPPEDGRLFALDAGSLSILGWEHALPVISRWNERAATRS